MTKRLLPILIALLTSVPAFAATYTISNLEELREFMEAVHGEDFSGNTIRLAADIDCGGGRFNTGDPENPSTFRGTFDGQGHVISNFVHAPTGHTDAGYGFAMFDFADTGATIKNLTLEGTLSGDSYSGAFSAPFVLAVENPLGLVMDNCHFRGTVKNYYYAAGLVGFASPGAGAEGAPSAILTNCTVQATATSTGYKPAGGLVAKGTGVYAFDCSMEGALTGMQTLGGLIAEAFDCNFERCSFEGTMGPGPGSSGSNYGCGGLVGYASNAVFRACTSSADITWKSYKANVFTAVGGAAGVTLGNSAFYDCSATSAVAVPYGRVGGFVGWTAGAETFSNCTANLTLELTDDKNSLVSGGFAASVASDGALFVDCTATAQGNDLKAGFYDNQEPKGEDVKVGTNTFRRCRVVDSTAKDAGFCVGAWNCMFEGCTVRGGTGAAGFVYNAGQRPDNEHGYEQTSTFTDCSVHGTRARFGFVEWSNNNDKNGHTNIFRRCRAGCVFGDSNLSGASDAGFAWTLNKGTLIEDCAAYGIADMGDFDGGFAASVSSGTTIRRSVAAVIPRTTDNRTAGFAYTLYSGSVVEDCYAVCGPVSPAVYGNGYYDYQQGYQGGFVRSCRIGQTEGSSPIRRSFALWPVPATTCPYVGSFAAVTPYSTYSTNYFEDCYRPDESPIGDCNNADAEGVEALSKAEFATATAATMPNYDFVNTWHAPNGAASSPYLDASVDENGDFWFLAALLGAEGRILVNGEAPKEAYPAGARLKVKAVADNPDLPFAGWVGEGFADPSAQTTTYTVRNVSAIAAKFCTPIYTVNDWTNKMSAYSTENFALMADLDFTEMMKETSWDRIRVGNFQGKFFGQGHTIRGICWTNVNEQYCGALFQEISAGAEIRDLTVESAFIPAASNVLGNAAGLVGTVGSGALVSNCHAVVDFRGTQHSRVDDAGRGYCKFYGLVANASGTDIRIVDCSVEGNIAGSAEACGFIGSADLTGGEIARCSAMGTFCATNGRGNPYGRASGFAGEITLRNGAEVRECFTAGVVDSVNAASGFAYQINLTDDQSIVRDCYSTAELIQRGGNWNDYGHAAGFAYYIYDNNDEDGVTVANCWFGGTARATNEYCHACGFARMLSGDVELRNCAFVQSDEVAEEMEGTAGVTAIAKADRLSTGSWAGYDFGGTWTMEGGKTTPYFAWSLADGAFRIFAMDETEGTAISHPETAEPGTQAAVAGDTELALAVDTWLGAAGYADAHAPETTFRADNHRTLRCSWKDAAPPVSNVTQTVTFDANGGAPATQKKTYQQNGKYNPLPGDPALADRVFGGWFTLPEGGTQITTNSTVTAVSNRTVYAHWRAFQNVTFEPNGGTCNPTGGRYEVGFPYGVLAAAERTGYSFAGWFDAADGGTQVSPAMTAAEPGAKTLYAHWSANVYAVGLERVSGSGGTTNVLATFDSPMPEIKPPTGYTGHTFQGYWSERDGAGTKYYNADGTSARDWGIAAATNLYGCWTANQYTATFDNQGGTGGTSTATVTYDQIVPAVTIPARTGYDFLGYFTEPDGKGDKYWNSDGSAYRYWMLTEDKTFHASWYAKCYSVSFDKQGGSGGWGSAGVYYGKMLPFMDELPTKDGYTFGGYWSEPNGGGVQYYAANGEPLRSWTTDGNGTLYAKWTRNGGGATATVTLDRQGGTGGTASVTATVGSAMPAIAVPSRAGYAFGGYFTAANGSGVQYYAADGTGVRNWDRDTATTLYAKWTPNGGGTTATVTLDRQGGTGGTASVTATVGSAMPAISVPTRTGFTFGGYFTAANGGGVQYYAANGTGVRNWDRGAATTLYAKWTSNGGGAPDPGPAPGPNPPVPAVATYKVQFNANGGTGAMAAQVIARNATASLRANAFAKGGSVFLGWAASANGEVVYGNGASVQNLAPAGGTATLYAKWAVEKYKVAFKKNGGKLPRGKKMSAQTMTYGKAAKLRKNAFKRNGYVFAGWAVSKGKAKKGTIAYRNAQKVVNLRTDGKTTKFYAVWAKPTYQVAFNANGGKGMMAPQTMKYGGKAAKLRKNAFKRNGYVFLGWAKKKSGKVAYKNGAKVKNLRIDGKTTTLYAKWAKVKYQVVFDANGGTGKMSAQTMKYGKAAALSKNAFERTGCTFAGWAKTADGPRVYTDGQTVQNLVSNGSTVKLFALWTAAAAPKGVDSAAKTKAATKGGPYPAAPGDKVFTVDDCGVFPVGSHLEVEISPDPPTVDELGDREDAEELPEPLALTFQVPESGTAWQLWSAARDVLAGEETASPTVSLQLPDLGLWYWVRFFDAEGGSLSSTWLFPSEAE